MRPLPRDLALTYGPPALIALAVIALQLIRFGGLYAASDDSYIYLGYVKRALQPPHALFSYNVGEHSAGTTGILYYYALLATALPLRALTFLWPLPATLLLALYVLNAALFIGCAGLLSRLARQVTDANPVWRVLALALLVGSVKFTWGMFAGLENPLTACLIVALIHAAARRASWAWIAVLSGLIVGARPELAPIMLLTPAFIIACWRLTTPTGMTWPNAGWSMIAATVLCAGVVAAIVLPCWLATGRVFPSSLGTRVAVDALGNFGVLWRGLAGFHPRMLARNDWARLSVALCATLLVLAPVRRNLRLPLAAMVVVTLQFVTRTIFGLNNLDQEDRYVSYLWPVYALAIVALLYATAGAFRGVRTALATPAVSGAVVIALVLTMALGPLREFDRRFTEDVTEMNQAVVTPSRWMRAHLPAGARISMEPAGAIRVFTDFYLLDVVGLTTDHRFAGGSFADYLTAHRVDYVFNYPGVIQELRDPARYERLMSWIPPPTFALGEIGVYRPKRQ